MPTGAHQMATCAASGQLSGELLAGIRGVVYRRALPLSTRELRMEVSQLGEWPVVGATILTVQHVLSPAGVASMIAPPA